MNKCTAPSGPPSEGPWAKVLWAAVLPCGRGCVVRGPVERNPACQRSQVLSTQHTQRWPHGYLVSPLSLRPVRGDCSPGLKWPCPPSLGWTPPGCGPCGWAAAGQQDSPGSRCVRAQQQHFPLLGLSLVALSGEVTGRERDTMWTEGQQEVGKASGGSSAGHCCPVSSVGQRSRERSLSHN